MHVYLEVGSTESKWAYFQVNMHRIVLTNRPTFSKQLAILRINVILHACAQHEKVIKKRKQKPYLSHTSLMICNHVFVSFTTVPHPHTLPGSKLNRTFFRTDIYKSIL